MNTERIFPLNGGYSGCTSLREKLTFAVLLLWTFGVPTLCEAQTNNNHLMMDVGCLYERGFDATIAYEHGSRYHNAWEYFATFYLKYDEDHNAGHITRHSFWNNYNSWHLGIAYKPCVSRGRNHHGNARIGASGGSDLSDFVGGLHVGYELTYALKHGWEVFFQVKEDVVIPRSGDLLRTGVTVGFKLPL